MAEGRAEGRYRAARAVALAGSVFSALIALLLLANLVQVRIVDPLRSPALEALRARLRDNPQDQELHEQIRAVDLLARKAFFASQWQRRAGGFLLLGSVTLTVLAARIAVGHHGALAVPGSPPDPDDWWREAARSRRSVAVAGGALLAVALVLALFPRSRIDEASAGSELPPAEGARFGDDDWPFFRGQEASGVARVKTAPLAWDGVSGRGVAWKAELPLPGNSSPIVVGDRIFLTGADARSREVFCYDRSDGALRWRRPVTSEAGGSERQPQVHPETGYAASTMASDGKRVFGIFATGDLVALDLDGRLLWAESLGVPDNHYGHASSLITYGDLLIVQWDQNADSRLVAYDTATGEVAWRAMRDVVSWASPILITTSRRTELVVANSRGVAAYDPRSGAALWRADCLSGELGPSPSFADGLVFVANDGATAAAVRPGGEVAWRYQDILPDTASPVATKDFVLLATSYGTLVCLDAKSGKERWTKDVGAGFRASPILVGERAYALDLEGTMHILKLGPSFEELGRAALGEPATATPAFVGGGILIRSQRALYSIAGE